MSKVLILWQATGSQLAREARPFPFFSQVTTATERLLVLTEPGCFLPDFPEGKEGARWRTHSYSCLIEDID